MRGTGTRKYLAVVVDFVESTQLRDTVDRQTSQSNIRVQEEEEEEGVYRYMAAARSGVIEIGGAEVGIGGRL